MSNRENTEDLEASTGDASADAPFTRPWFVGATGGLFLLIAALICVDYLLGAQEHDVRAHAAIELGLMTIAVVAGMVFWYRFVVLRKRERVLVRHLHEANAEATRWRRDAEGLLRGLGAAIDDQFDRWALSAAEREVALLLLKGLAHKEIAGLRGTTEKTVRQQALVVYRKAGLSGRAELSAFFLEDLLLPPRMDQAMAP